MCLLKSDPPLESCLTPYQFLPSWYHPKCTQLSPETVLHTWHPPKEPYEIPSTEWYKFPVQKNVTIASVFIQNFFISNTYNENLLLILLKLKCHSSINIWVVIFILQLLQNIWITYNSHGYHPQLVPENWNISLSGV